MYARIKFVEEFL